MRLPQAPQATIKNILHGTQGLLIFFSWVLTIAVFTRSGSTDGRTTWFFALCWLSIPTLIYLVMVPMWSRARRFAHAYAFAALDVLFTILWFSGWVAVASYVGSGSGKGKDTKKSGCENFKYGSPAKCKMSEATVFLGVGVFLLFIGTSYLSLQTAFHFRQTGTMPEPSDSSFAAQTKAAFASNPQPNEFDADFDAEDELHHQPPPPAVGIGISGLHRPRRDDDEYALLHQSEEQLHDLGLAHPGRPVSYGQPTRDDGSVQPVPVVYGGYNTGSYANEDTSYGGPYGQHRNGSVGSGRAAGDPFRSDLELSHEMEAPDERGGYGGVAPPPRYER